MGVASGANVAILWKLVSRERAIDAKSSRDFGEILSQSFSEAGRKFKGAFVGHEMHYIFRSVDEGDAVLALSQMFLKLRAKLRV